jgi:glycosyltransferase involved in cell wall biosynthesis
VKPKVLLVGEASVTSTGYGVMAREINRRLHDSGQVDVVELGTGLPWDDPRQGDIPWTYVNNSPRPGEEGFDADQLNSFGKWRFNQTAIDHQVDQVFDWRDPWHCEFQLTSPLRPRYHLAWMPTIDSHPQAEAWLDSYARVDTVFAYSEYGREVMAREGGGRIPFHGVTPPGIDSKVFRPVADRAAHKASLGIDPSWLVVGFVARNQVRKLFPDLIQAFARFVNTGPESVRSRTYLLLHTVYPDVGWDLARILREEGVGHRVLFSYSCRDCGAIFPAHFQNNRGTCKACGRYSAVMPHSGAGIPAEAMAALYNLMDFYVQFVTNEGFGIPVAEAAACEVPVSATDYSATSEIVREAGGFPLPVKRWFRDSATHLVRALPDQDALVNVLSEFLVLPQSVRRARGIQAREAAIRLYNYDRTAKFWLDRILQVGKAGRWGGPPRFHQPPPDAPQGLDDWAFVGFCLHQVAGRPDLVNGFLHSRLVRDLEWGAAVTHGGEILFSDMSMWGLPTRFTPVDRQTVWRQCVAMANESNKWELAVANSQRTR